MKYLELNKNRNITYKNSWGAGKTQKREKFHPNVQSSFVCNGFKLETT